MKKIALISLGCPKNQVDSEVMLGLLSARGYELVEDLSVADWIIVNTCGFIESAKEESIEAILEAAEYKQSGNCEKLAVTGCLAQRYQKEILEELPEIDVVTGTADYHKIVTLLEEDVTEQFGDIDSSPDYSLLPRVNSMPFYTAYLKIADGCDNHCTYCIIPSIRGKYRSRSIEELVAEAEELVKTGVRELILVAQDTTAYGKDLYGEPKLA
ncbi:MAG: radical SAM protein, partial [Ruminococcaceae bacterium]|nr:radical SAM protein [Oscillospiraceae bacterium]